MRQYNRFVRLQEDQPHTGEVVNTYVGLREPSMYDHRPRLFVGANLLNLNYGAMERFRLVGELCGGTRTNEGPYNPRDYVKKLRAIAAELTKHAEEVEEILNEYEKFPDLSSLFRKDDNG